jgi:hypothetical protein
MEDILEGYIVAIILEFLGFSPGRFNLRGSSRRLQRTEQPPGNSLVPYPMFCSFLVKLSLVAWVSGYSKRTEAAIIADLALPAPIR